jgi:hypothetical protein
MTDFYDALAGLDQIISRYIGAPDNAFAFGESPTLPEHPGGGRLIPGGKRLHEPKLTDMGMPPVLKLGDRTQPKAPLQPSPERGELDAPHPSGWRVHQQIHHSQGEHMDLYEYHVSHPMHTGGNPITVTLFNDYQNKESSTGGLKFHTPETRQSFEQLIKDWHGPDHRIWHL